uniref:cysteine--tRNA ligase n=1 Tax=Theileria annulata TaxID=5874 RepID=A0A3B0MSF7_THEAN
MFFSALLLCIFNVMLYLRGINTFKLINRALIKDSIHFNNYLDFKRMASESDLRKWEIPSKKDKFLTGLYVKNSLNPSSKVEFVPEEGRKVRWYTCGPTVYDAAHMGHARTYIACDTIRSILENYLNYDLFFVENITDVEDKIIQRALNEGKPFTEVTSHWEKEFWNDMLSLGVSLPDCITRVSDYMTEIVDFIKKILDNGYAYVSDGSVYFDIESFRNSGKHVYAKLEPTSFNDLNRILDAEGTLGEVSLNKKSKSDFALWKKSKVNEPSWESPWGRGRPGWHIECSAMSTCIFGKEVFDIHSGGIDLRFPHHDNEIAQSEAYFDTNRWANYFLHFGHLHIHGLKMSKSLKNFITVKEMLTKYNKRQIRLLFLNSRYDSTLNFNSGPDGMDEPIAIDETFFNFFSTLNSKLSNLSLDQKWSEDDLNLNKEFEKLKSNVHAAFLDNFDTPKVLSNLCKFISTVNTFMFDPKNQIKYTQALLFKQYLYRILGVLKLVEPGCEYGVENKSESSENEKSLLNELVDLRQKTRAFAQATLKNKVDSETTKELLKQCDRLRDQTLPNLGIILEDCDDGTSVVKYKSLKDQQLEKARKELKKEQRLQDENERLQRLSIPPEEFIHKTYPNKFGKLDENHLPLEYSDGTPISKSERKSIEKVFFIDYILFRLWKNTRGNTIKGWRHNLMQCINLINLGIYYI